MSVTAVLDTTGDLVSHILTGLEVSHNQGFALIFFLGGGFVCFRLVIASLFVGCSKQATITVWCLTRVRISRICTLPLTLLPPFLPLSHQSILESEDLDKASAALMNHVVARVTSLEEDLGTARAAAAASEDLVRFINQIKGFDVWPVCRF